MNTITYKLSRKDRTNIFLYLYYTYPVLKYIRMAAGPALIAVGIMVLQMQFEFNYVYAAVSIGLGIYYLFKPFISIFMNGHNFNEIKEKLSLNGKKKELHISSKDINTSIKIDKVLSVVEVNQGGYKIGLKVENRKLFFLILNKTIIDGDLPEFIETLKGLI